MKDIDLVKKILGYAESAKDNGYQVLTVPLRDLFSVIEQLEAAQRERDMEVQYKREAWCEYHKLEAELKRRDEQEPIYQMRLLDGGEGEQEWLEVTKEEYSTPTTTKFGTWERRKLYAAAPAAVPEVKPIELPALYKPTIVRTYGGNKGGMSLSKTGKWFNAARVIAALEAAKIPFKFKE